MALNHAWRRPDELSITLLYSPLALYCLRRENATVFPAFHKNFTKAYRSGNTDAMPLQNRVTPAGEIVANPARGLFMGNRGILHDSDRRLHPTRRWTHKAWICCLCADKGRRRAVMTPGRYTELFFLDEATALAAGHRPCFECRREAATRFAAAWAQGNGSPRPSASEMDAILHGEWLNGKEKRRHPLPGPPETLPDGTMVAAGDEAFLVSGGRFRPWSFAGYGKPVAAPARLLLLTPPSTVNALRAGYPVSAHPSARAD